MSNLNFGSPSSSFLVKNGVAVKLGLSRKRICWRKADEDGSTRDMSGNGHGNTLGGGPASDPPPSTWGRGSAPRIGRINDLSNSGASAGRGTRGSGPIATLSSLGSSNAVPPRPPTGREEDDDETGARESENWFTGGGLNVQNPNARRNLPGPRMVQDILRRAAETSAARAAQPSAEQPRSSMFRGSGNTLGSDEVESTFVPDPDAQQEVEAEAAQRNITFWRNGFSIEGGEFYAYANPENEQLLEEINTGRAPVSVLNVRPGQPVEVIVSKRMTEDYVPEKRSFGGSGNRLGSPVPLAVGTSSAPSIIAPTGGAERTGVTTLFEVDQSQPTTTVQIRLADGTRIPCRMNLTHTVGDIRQFINASRPENAMRVYTIGTTFPNKTLDDDKATIGESELANSVIVQRWV